MAAATRGLGSGLHSICVGQKTERVRTVTNVRFSSTSSSSENSMCWCVSVFCAVLINRYLFTGFKFILFLPFCTKSTGDLPFSSGSSDQWLYLVLFLFRSGFSLV